MFSDQAGKAPNEDEMSPLMKTGFFLYERIIIVLTLYRTYESKFNFTSSCKQHIRL
jgi:hypothetical protein